MASAKKPAPAKTAAAKKSVASAKPPAPEVKAPARPAAKAPAAAKPAAPAPKPAAKPVKAPKVKKVKPVRDSFTMPKAEYAVLDALKLRASKLGSPVKKSELLRAGVKAIAAMADAAFLAAVKAVPTIKTGRPAMVKK